MYSEHGWSNLEGDRARAAEQERALVARRARERDEADRRLREYQRLLQANRGTFTRSFASGGDLDGLVALILLPFSLAWLLIVGAVSVFEWVWNRVWCLFH
jgi:hypothetical protein